MSQKARKELEELYRLLQLEKQEDFEQFKQLIESMPLEVRKAKGYSWYPVQVVDSGYTIGERAYVTVQRAEGSEEEHQFRPGKTVRFFTLQSGASSPERSGVIYFVSGNRMKIILGAKDLPEWIGMGQLGVDLMFDETTYQEMEKALTKVMEAKKGKLAELRAVLLGEKPASFSRVELPADFPQLNASQNEAVRRLLMAQDVTVIHGPPGTGKTTTLVQAVWRLCETEATVLVTAPSNTAVDLLTERLAAEELNVVRVGNISRIDESILQHTLEVRLAEHPESKNIKKIKQKAAEYRRKARRYKRQFGREEYLQRKQLFSEASEMMQWANQLEDRLIEQLLDSAQVITCTLVGAAHRVLEKRRFRTVVIDEAAQALEPASWIPIQKASRVVLTGDPFQLPPTVKSREAEKGGLNVTLIEKSLQRQAEVSLLRVQYRMHETIMGFSNRQFYKGMLQADAAVQHHRLPIGNNHPLIFIDTAGCGFDEQMREAYRSRYNPQEFQVLCEHLYQLVDAFYGQPPPSIALISPYREQVLYMQDGLATDPKLSPLPIRVNTIDGFQGQESDVVYLSLVRSNEKGAIGFLKDYRRMNVAMTRARKQLVMVGDSATLGNNAFYRDFLEYCEQYGAYLTAWEYII